MQQGPPQPPPQRQFNVNLGGLSTADKIILAGAGFFFIWSFIPVWYHVGPFNFSAWHGITTFSGILALAGLVWTGLRIAGVTSGMRVNFPIAYIDLGLAGLALLLTLLGLIVRPSAVVVTAGLQWGYFVGLIAAIAWAYGAYMRYQELGASTGATGGMPPAAPPPGPPGGGGFQG
jgi:hypothetical protein